MKLRVKIGLSFAVAFVVFVVILSVGLIGVLDAVSGKLMRKQAEDITVLITHEIMDASGEGGFFNPTAAFATFDRVKHVSDAEESFQISKNSLINSEMVTVASFPKSEIGADYSAHEDVRESLNEKKRIIADENYTDAEGVSRREIDVVSYFELGSGSAYVIEVKFDFARSTALLEKQYAVIEIGAVGVSLFLLAFLLGSLLILVGRSAVRPVAEITRAMEKVGTGDLDVTLAGKGSDEFSLMAIRFNEMTRGLKEKLQLSQYVSRSTVEAVRVSIGSGETGHAVQKRHCVLFFSDIRGFTTYSETRDPGKVVETLNLILSLQADIIKKLGGDVDKFVGDEVMAVFSGASAAMEAAFEIQKAMASRRAEFDNLGIGIGIHEGDVVQGDVGSAEIRNYTVIGDTVNTAARLESMARAGEILVSGRVADHEESRSRFVFEEKGELKLKGKEVTILTFSIKARKKK